MPVMKCIRDGKDGLKWNESGVCFIGENSKQRAENVGAAIRSNRTDEKTYKPTKAMASAAKRGLAMREKQPPSNRGMTSVGLARANQLIRGENLSLSTVKRMYSFFSRHEVDKSSDSWKKGNSKAEQGWLGWGGDAGYSWARKIVESLD
jgi:hypothetical protein